MFYIFINLFIQPSTHDTNMPTEIPAEKRLQKLFWMPLGRIVNNNSSKNR